MTTGVRAYVGSPVALAWTLLGAAAVGGVVATGWRLVRAVTTWTTLTDPTVLDGLGSVLAWALGSTAVLAVCGAVWLPCSVAIAHAVGGTHRGRPPTGAETARRVASRAEPLYRWVKTRLAVGPLAERLLTEDDVSAAEVAVGCDAFVVPAIALDAPTLPFAVERANRVVPEPGRRQVQFVGVGATATLVAVAWGLGVALGSTLGAGVVSSATLAGGVGVVGLVVTAAVDTAWRAGVYATSDLDEGFSR
ncbi:MAG: hypothetical protein RI568_08540 [Natronomonas sp.]|jgi:hypothetical protein|uniref:hypothetical protein n=1 Tax=Natronomonas sp. TaxID=2184060 RepID=UPI00286FD726|nr:hypothetical protein [Natronomonas sp.]MDR9430728.1 hypothetical protein [Natronomonas sp.]